MRTLLHLAFLCLSLSVATGLIAQERCLHSTLLELTAYESQKFPIVVLDILALKGGRPAIADPAAAAGQFTIWESEDSCSIVSVVPGTRQLQYDLRLYVDLSVPTPVEFHAVLNLAQTVVRSPGFRISPFFHTRRADRMVQLSVKELGNLALDSVPDPTFTVHMLIDHLRSLGASQEANGQIILAVLDTLTSTDLVDLASATKEFPGRAPSWLVVLAHDVKGNDMHRPPEESVLMHDWISSPPGHRDTTVRKALGSIADARYQVTLRSNRRVTPDTVRSFRLGLHVPASGKPPKPDTLAMVFTIKVPRDVVNARFIDHYVGIASDLARLKHYIQALDSLKSGYQLLPAVAISAEAERVIRAYGESLLKEGGASSCAPLCDRAEEDWNIATNKHDWYKQLKTELLERRLKAEDENLDGSIEVLEQLANVHPEKRSYAARLYVLRGDLACAKGEEWEGAAMYGRSQSLQDDASVRGKLQRTVANAVSTDYGSSNFSRLYEQGKTFLKQVNGQFDLRFMHGVAAARMKDYALAATHLEWCVLNWSRTTRLTTWDNLFARLQEIYGLALRFDDAYRVNRRLYQQRGDKVMLLQALKHLRSRWALPVAVLFPVFWGRNTSPSTRSAFFRASPLTVAPGFFIGLSVVSPSGKERYRIRSSRDMSVPARDLLDTLAEYPALIEQPADQENWWIVSRLSDGYVILQLSTASDERTQVILSSIRERKMFDEPWSQLVNSEQTVGVRFVGEMVTGMITAEFESRGSTRLDSYWDAARPNTLIQYMVLHATKGEIAQNQGFNAAKAKHDQALWIRSSAALAYFTQNAEYGGQPIIDVCNPVYVNKVWKAALRMGLRKY